MPVKMINVYKELVEGKIINELTGIISLVVNVIILLFYRI